MHNVYWDTLYVYNTILSYFFSRQHNLYYTVLKLSAIFSRRYYVNDTKLSPSALIRQYILYFPYYTNKDKQYL